MGYLSVWKFSYILLIFSFPMSASNHLNASVFQHFTDTGYSWALFFAVDQTTYTNMHNFYVFTDQPVNFFQNSFVIIWFCRIHTFTSIACHHCCQTGILGIFLKKGLPFHKKPSDIPPWHRHRWNEDRSKFRSLSFFSPFNSCACLFYKNKICIFP